MNKNVNALNWFEIPAKDINRAKSFYEGIFDIQMDPIMEMMGMKMTFFPAENGNGKVSGGLAESQMHAPSQEGTVVYLNANESGMDNVLSRVDGKGGKVVMPKTQISPEIGYMAFFIDSEGNKIGLHAQN
jgi:predicted enzyme related to lactoylglutathione lyase